MAENSHERFGPDTVDRFPLNRIDPQLFALDKTGFLALLGPKTGETDEIGYVPPNPGSLKAPGARDLDSMSATTNLSPYAALKAQYGLLPSTPDKKSEQLPKTPSPPESPNEPDLNLLQVGTPLNKAPAETLASPFRASEPSGNHQLERESRASAIMDFGQFKSPMVTQTPNVNAFNQPDMATARMTLGVSVFPPYHAFLFNPTIDMFPVPGSAPANPTQGYLPPYMLPAHPVFLYYGRDLSKPHMPLPRRGSDPPFFVRRLGNFGDFTDHGFGPGVEVNEVYRIEVLEAVIQAMDLYLEKLLKTMDQEPATV